MSSTKDSKMLDALLAMRRARGETDLTMEDLQREYGVDVMEVEVKPLAEVIKAEDIQAPIADAPAVDVPVETISASSIMNSVLTAEAPQVEVAVPAAVPSVMTIDRSLTTDQQLSSIEEQSAARQEVREIVVKPDVPVENIQIEVKVEKPKEESVEIPNNDFFDMVDDLEKLEVGEGSAFGELAYDRFLNARKPSTAVVCLSSAYSAHMIAISLAARSALRNSTTSAHDATRKLYETIYNHIQESAPKKPDFDTWLSMTAMLDINTLVYGIYAMTYKESNEYTIKCNSCKHDNKIGIAPHDLIYVQDPDIKLRVLDIIGKVNSFKELKGNSIVGKLKRIKLRDSKMIVDMHMPSLADHLITLKRFNPETMKDYQAAIELSTFIKTVMIYDEELSTANGRPIFQPVTNRDRIVNLIASVSSESDEKALTTAMDDDFKKYTIEYKIPQFSCGGIGCGKPIGPIPVDLVSMLFTRLAEE